MVVGFEVVVGETDVGPVDVGATLVNGPLEESTGATVAGPLSASAHAPATKEATTGIIKGPNARLVLMGFKAPTDGRGIIKNCEDNRIVNAHMEAVKRAGASPRMARNSLS